MARPRSRRNPPNDEGLDAVRLMIELRRWADEVRRWCGSGLVHHPSNPLARRLLLASIVYLPSVFGLAVLAKWW